MLSVVNNPYGDLLTYWPAILISIIIVIVPGIKHVGVLITSLVHEIGHGLVALPFGGFSSGVNISGDGSGSMNSGKLFKPVQIVMLLSGYGFPVHLGLALIVAA